MGWFASRPGISGLARVSVVVVSASLVVTVAGEADAVTSASRVAVSAKAATAAPVSKAVDVVSARIAARSQKSRVEVSGAETESSRTFANPDGSLTVESSAGPVRVKQADGSWADVDLGLVKGKAGVGSGGVDRTQFGGHRG